MAEVVVIGSGEAFDPMLPNTSLLYRGAITLLVDCGFGVPHALWPRFGDASLMDAVYLTHEHADHTFGLPALLLWMKEEGRARPLEVIGGPGVEPWLGKLLDLAYPGAYRECFPIRAVELAPGERLERNGAMLRNAQSAHGTRNLALRIDEGSVSFCHSGDGRPTPATRELYRDATLLTHECYWASRESEGHARFAELLSLSDEQRIGTLALVHLGRAQKDEIRSLAVASHRRVLIPGPGDVLPVG